MAPESASTDGTVDPDGPGDATGSLDAADRSDSDPGSAPGPTSSPDATAPESTSTDPPPPPEPSQLNVLLIIADDYGVISADAYRDRWSPASTGATPTVNTICERGVRFLNTWSNATCSATRGTLLTGRYAMRTGVGRPVGRDELGLRPGESTLPRVLAAHDAPHARLSVGKWHLGIVDAVDGIRSPNFFGWEHFAGHPAGTLPSYYEWPRIEDGVQQTTHTYATTQNVDDALRWVDALEPDQPWVLWVGFNAPHWPFVLPPPGLHEHDDLEDLGWNALLDSGRPLRPYFDALVEGMDHEMGRLFEGLGDDDGDGLPDDTLVVFVGDNGTDSRVLADPWTAVEDRAKFTRYEHGLRVPLCVAGPGVDGGRDSDALVNTVDVFTTVLDAVDVPVPDEQTVDGLSLMPVLRSADEEFPRAMLYAEGTGTTKFGAAGDQRYRYLVSAGPDGRREECYDIDADPFELDDRARDPDRPAQCDALRASMLELACDDEVDRAAWCPRD